jgi:CheY-specific phosphatase CheX
MTPTSGRPDLCRIGGSAFTEVLSVLLSLPARIHEPLGDSHLSIAPEQITSKVHLAGQRLSGSVNLQLPLDFVSRAVQFLTGLDGDSREAKELQEDTAAELANMVAGRVAAQLAKDGYACTLGTPSVSRGAGLPVEIEPGMDYGQTDLVCDGHRLSIELKCRYATA